MALHRSVFAGFAQLAEEVGQASRANRELFEQLVAAEVGRVAARLGVVPAAELRDARERLDSAENELDVLRLELDDLQLRVAVLELAAREAGPTDEDLADDDAPGTPDAPGVLDAPDLLGDETDVAGVRG